MVAWWCGGATTPLIPLIPLTCTDQQSIPQPGLEELVLGGLVDVDVTAEEELHVTGIIDEHHQLGADPHLGDVLEGGALPDDCSENGYKCDLNNIY